MSEIMGRLDRREEWCRAGPTWKEAGQAVDGVSVAGALEQIARDSDRSDDYRAASHLAVFTGLIPELRDMRGSGDGRADLLLKGDESYVEVVEITSSLSNTFMQARFGWDRLIAEIGEAYTGEDHWSLHLQRVLIDELPRTQAKRQALIKRLLDELESLSVGPPDVPVKLTSLYHVLARRHRSESAGVSIASWNAEVESTDGDPYLSRLSDYLKGYSGIKRKRRKLEAERTLLSASRTHLYLLMANTGEWGSLLPMTPADFGQTDFQSLPEITDLWLDGGTGVLYHWSQEQGWLYHRLD